MFISLIISLLLIILRQCDYFYNPFIYSLVNDVSAILMTVVITSIYMLGTYYSYFIDIVDSPINDDSLEKNL